VANPVCRFPRFSMLGQVDRISKRYAKNERRSWMVIFVGGTSEG
jgi:hypothetical protein